MAHRGLPTACMLVLIASTDVSAQIIIAPPPPPPGQIIVGPIFRRQITIVTTVFPLPPPPVVYYQPRPIFPQQPVDLSGVDFDLVGPEALQPNLAKAPPRKAVEAAKPAEAPRPPKVVEQPKKQPAAKPLPEKAPAQPPPKANPPGLPPPKAEPIDESRRLVNLGLDSFTAKEYGLAAMRFRQAIEADKAQGQPYFLLAQAYYAMGRYKDAVAAIEKGMQRVEDWPLSASQPRVDLYKGIEDDWFAHKKQLEDARTLNPKQPAYLFLQAYQLWFDGQRDQALDLFRQAKALSPDNVFIDAFLRAAPKLVAN